MENTGSPLSPAQMPETQIVSRIDAVVNLGLGANIFLAVAKITTGILAHSQALLADGINSVSDVVYYLVIRIFLRLAHKPADQEHPFGHRQLETIAALIVGAFVVTTAVTVFWDSINTVYDLVTGRDGPRQVLLFAFWIALLTIVIKVILSVYTMKVGRRTANAAIMALAHDHRNDIFSALAAALGILFGSMGYSWVDPLAGALVSLVILRTGIRILRDSSSELMDRVPGGTLARQVREIAARFPEIKEVEEVLAHRFGPYFVVNITIGIDGSLSVSDGDRIATELEKELDRRIGALRKAYIHYHPARQGPRKEPARRSSRKAPAP